MLKVSNSKIQCYKSCRRMFELKYIENLYPVQKSEAFERGSNYHDKVESILRSGSFEVDEPKSSAMATAFQKYIYPQLAPIAEEEWFDYKTEFGDEVIGRVDARNADGALIEHKTTSMAIDEAYWYGVQTDEQLLTYMNAYGVRKAYYTVCKSPTIRQKANETDEEFYARCCAWYDDDPESKIVMREVYHTEDEINDFAREQALTIREMDNCNLFYRNRSYCNKWGKMCEYAPICEHYDREQEYVQFERKEKEQE